MGNRVVCRYQKRLSLGVQMREKSERESTRCEMDAARRVANKGRTRQRLVVVRVGIADATLVDLELAFQLGQARRVDNLGDALRPTALAQRDAVDTRKRE